MTTEYLEGWAAHLQEIEDSEDPGGAAHELVSNSEAVSFTVDGGIPWWTAGSLAVEMVHLIPSQFDAYGLELRCAPGNSTVTLHANYGGATSEMLLTLPALAGELQALADAWRYEGKEDA